MARTTKTRSKQARNVYAEITERICKAIESGATPPWRKPWTGGGTMIPANLMRRTEPGGGVYRGINVFLLTLAGYTSRWWVTANQADELAARTLRKAGTDVVKHKRDKGDKDSPRTGWYEVDADGNLGERIIGVEDGERSTEVVLWKWITKVDKDDLDENGEPKRKRFPMLRTYNVYNVEQCKHAVQAHAPTEGPIERTPEEIDATAEGIVATFKATDGPTVKHNGGDRAYYRPATDAVAMPKRERFDGSAEYYSTLFHELGHATGHPSRLNRSGISGHLTGSINFGDHAYSREELVAEFTAAFLCGEAGVATPSATANSTAYLARWLKELRSDPKMLVVAAAQAQKSADWILGREGAEVSED